MQSLNGIWTLFVLVVAFLAFGVIACLPRWGSIVAGRAFAKAQDDLLAEAQRLRDAEIAERTPPPRRPPRPSALNFDARKDRRPG